MATSPISGVDQNQFLTLLVTQLKNQDPFNPVSSDDFLGQITSLNTLQGITTLNASFSEVLKLQQLTQGVGLIGKQVEYAPPAGGPAASGTVESVAVQDGKYVLDIGGNQVGLDQILSVRG
ncbi:Marine sediment metagenome DNA, contig: S01H1_L05777 OS=marine sediment metagenome GN=S01H1_14598 PE=4 SV=1: FlgD [Gemmataceae bacterium]|jgi:flagellar basal-body rod modification protein FlgD|nr:Marine sediment metagenome DNA, contig: S01H1_L05777 OS=marine sediment metagenome GN=S01H1_14598 PE=4 SV=1: FlgD [Gemmataceae bacterium]VTT97916.1 Marine sediment metagenome DNA, contig: S01H1_L05777 OS=marine sediment metagenome GN=S01H1_14598 PE=4 SV=1: FlgD [Gemmataceae bacterium]